MRARSDGRALRALLIVLAASAAVAPAEATEPVLVLRDAADAVRSDLPDPAAAPYLGVLTVEESRGLRVRRVVPESPAAAAGLRIGDLLLRVDDTRLQGVDLLRDRLAAAGPAGRISLELERNRVRLTRLVDVGRSERPSPYFRGDRFRLLVVPLAFADDDAGLPTREELRRFYFDRTGTLGAGASLADYFAAQSNGTLTVAGEVAPTLRLARARSAYSEFPMGAQAGSLYADAARALGLGYGGTSPGTYDGIAFVHAGEPETRSSRALWPHRAMVTVGGHVLPYFVHAGASIGDGVLGEHCHEFTHLLGIPDSYGVGHVTGFGDYCLMAIGHRGGGETRARSPFSLCANCRMRLGWCDVTRVDPRVPQRLRLAAPADGRDTVVLIPLVASGEEFVLLETRASTGFDAELPSTGLLVWHVGGTPTPGQGPYGGPVDLVEAHGVDTFDAAMVRPDRIAFPTERARDVTPETSPSVTSTRPGSFAFRLTAIERLPDGSVAFTIGDPRPVEQAPPEPYDGDLPGPDGYVVREDPVTGRVVRFLSQRKVGDPEVPPEASSARRR